MRCRSLVASLDCKWPAAALLVLQLAAAPAAWAADVGVIGVFPGKGAVLVVDGGAPQSVRIGQKLGGITLVSVDKTGAVIEDEARRRRTVPLGQHLNGAPSPTGRAPQVTLSADSRGQFITESTVNGSPMRFMVDTGATMVSIPGTEARRLGIDFSKGQKGVAQTANGPAPVYRIKLDSVKVGEIELLNVDAIVLDGGGLAQPLLGMSFLNRVEMRREGDSMTLVRRF
ncbi:MAG: TIGR02281 family clan AA aspartic protease [Proteobacteria bacterium]|nr:TIGR02281 family clan AA aspartic protease [Pseudomonadota bacterium]